MIAEMLPDQMAAAIRPLQAKGRQVAMAGDGINDAPMQAQVGIALGRRGIVRARRLSRVGGRPEPRVTSGGRHRRSKAASPLAIRAGSAQAGRRG